MQDSAFSGTKSPPAKGRPDKTSGRGGCCRGRGRRARLEAATILILLMNKLINFPSLTPELRPALLESAEILRAATVSAGLLQPSRLAS